MQIHMLIIPLGIMTYAFLILTVLSGVLIMKYHVKWVKMKMHLILGMITLVLASLHAGIIIYLNR